MLDRHIVIKTLLILAPSLNVGASAQESRPVNPLIVGLVERIRPTQVRVEHQVAGGQSSFRATVVGMKPDAMVLLTSAHCVPDLMRDDVLQLSHGSVAWQARIASVVMDPSYRQDVPVIGPGPDSALVRLDVPAESKGWSEAARSLRPAELSDDPGLRPSGEAVSALILNQDEVAHVVRAANFRNPRWLEWGRKLQLRPGDSGSGIFVAKPDGKGGARPVLIGSVSVRDLEGGGGTLVWRRARWVAEALAAPR